MSLQTKHRIRRPVSRQSTNLAGGAATLLVIVGLVITTMVATIWAAPIPYGWSRAQNLSPGSVPASSAMMARDPVTGNLHAVWEADVFGEEEIIARLWQASTQTWGPEQNLSNFEWSDDAPSIIFTQEGEGHLLWTRRYAKARGAPEDGTDLMWRLWDGTGWTKEKVLLHVDAHLPATYGPVLTESADSVLLFLVWSQGFRQTEFRDGAWSELTPWDYSLEVSFAQVLVDGEEKWHAAAYGPNDNLFAAWYYDAYYVKHDGVAWSSPLNLSESDGVVKDLGMAFDSQGRLHYLWSDPLWTGSGSIKSAIWERIYDGGEWTPNTEVTTDNDAQTIDGFSLTTEANGTLHLAWSEGLLQDIKDLNLGIYYQTGDGNQWGPEEKVYGSEAESRYPILTVGDNGAAVLWQEGLSTERDVLFSRQVVPGTEPYQYYLPMISR